MYYCSCILTIILYLFSLSLRWRHNELDGVSDHQPRDCLLNLLFRRRSKITSKLRVTGLCAGNSPGTGEFPAQKAGNAENVSIWWRHHVIVQYISLNMHAISLGFVYVVVHVIFLMTSVNWFHNSMAWNCNLIVPSSSRARWYSEWPICVALYPSFFLRNIVSQYLDNHFLSYAQVCPYTNNG